MPLVCGCRAIKGQLKGAGSECFSDDGRMTDAVAVEEAAAGFDPVYGAKSLHRERHRQGRLRGRGDEVRESCLIMNKVSVLFVCMGNICRSPTAEAVFRQYVENAGLSGHILIDSAGTHDYHIGDPPDLRTRHAAQQRGYDMSGLRGRQVEGEDFHRFDYVLAMDKANLAALQRLMPPASDAQVRLFLEYARHHAVLEVPDPYYGGEDGFERVLDMVEDAAEGLLQHIRQRHFDR